MARRQLWEIHEQPWCPPPVRQGATDVLNAIALWGRQYRHIIPKLRNALAATQTREVVDLCSGSGGPWLQLYSHIHNGEQPITILLTDLYPNLSAMRAASAASNGRICFMPTPVDATQLDPRLVGFRTLFTAFHHFPPEAARAILQDAVQQRQGIAIFEQTSRRWWALAMMLTLPWIALLTAPFIRPFRLSRLFWTYLLPAIPLVLCIDGIISCLRTYSPREMKEMIAGLQRSGYLWEVGHAPSPLSPVGIQYLIGYPLDQVGDKSAAESAPRVEVMK